jgi:glutaminyl-peptide cyclotransferase
LLDMIAGKNARFPAEQNSWFKAENLVHQIWQIAADLKCSAFKNELGQDIRDDHLALNQAGIPAVDIIDFDYPHWHRLSDVPENCSAESLDQVARVLMTWLQQVK